MQSDREATVREISVRELVEGAPAELEIAVIAGAAGLESHTVSSDRIQKLGLALGGFRQYLHRGRIQMIGTSEISYLGTLSPKDRLRALSSIELGSLSCILITKGLDVPEGLADLCDGSATPLIRTPAVSSKAIALITDYLQRRLAPTSTQHGVLLEMFGIGVLIIGESGIGKSECALDLVSRGHRLVADDSVRISRVGHQLSGDSPVLTHEHLEIRGLGIVNIRELFGASAICERILIDLCIELKKWSDVEHIERIGLETQKLDIFGVEIPQFTIPVSPGRNLSTLIETAVRVYQLRASGYDAARVLIERHDRLLRRNSGASGGD